MQVVISFDLIFCFKFGWLIWCIVLQVDYFLIFHYYIIILILIYISFGVSVSLSTVSEVFWGDSFVILLALLLPIKSAVASAVF